MGWLKIDYGAIYDLQEAMKAYEGNTENAINEVLRNEGVPLLKESIRRLIPVSGRTWKGKAPAAKKGRSLAHGWGNLAVTVKSSKTHGYLYFPDDGSNTRRHAGNQQFFFRGGQAKANEILDRCIKRLVEDFDNI